VIRDNDILIADSGGTKTDWVAISEGKIVQRWSTESLHPTRLSQFDADSLNEYLNFHLEFFGAGCLNNVGREKVSQKLNDIGFKSFQVKSDLEAAGLALFGNTTGNGIIAGTGSVIFQFEDQKIKKISGGLGHLLGDEGSGFFFGKLLLKEYLENQLPKDLSLFLEEKIGSREEVLKNVYGENAKSYVASLSLLTSSLYHPSILEIHKMNIQFLVNQVKKDNPDNATYSACGSYVFSQKELFKEIFNQNDFKLNKILERPLESLTDYFLSHTD
jgi:glucosamine kinase